MPIYKARVKVEAGYGDRKFVDARVEARNPTDARRQLELTYGKGNMASTISRES